MYHILFKFFLSLKLRNFLVNFRNFLLRFLLWTPSIVKITSDTCNQHFAWEKLAEWNHHQAYCLKESSHISQKVKNICRNSLADCFKWIKLKDNFKEHLVVKQTLFIIIKIFFFYIRRFDEFYLRISVIEAISKKIILRSLFFYIFSINTEPI